MKKIKIYSIHKQRNKIKIFNLFYKSKLQYLMTMIKKPKKLYQKLKCMQQLYKIIYNRKKTNRMKIDLMMDFQVALNFIVPNMEYLKNTKKNQEVQPLNCNS